MQNCKKGGIVPPSPSAGLRFLAIVFGRVPAFDWAKGGPYSTTIL